MLEVNRSATLATGPFRNSIWHLGQDNLLTMLFSADNLTLQCRDCDTYRYTVILTLGLWQQELVSDSSPKLSLSLSSELYIHITTLPEDGEPAYQIYIGRRPTKNGTE